MLINLVARRTFFAVVLVALTAGKASAQFDLAGSWAPLGTEDVQNDSVPVDYLGLALTDEARTRALSYDESQKSMIERQCAGWGAAYMVLGPFGLRVTSQTDPVTNRLVSFTIAAWEDWNEMVIWMDGRPRPSDHALHAQAGFTTGRWEGGALAARTTHVKAGFIRKTGAVDRPRHDRLALLPPRRRRDRANGRHRSGLSRRAGNHLERLSAVPHVPRLSRRVRDGLRRAGTR